MPFIIGPGSSYFSLSFSNRAGFGRGVALCGCTLAVAAYNAGLGGAVYIFRFDDLAFSNPRLVREIIAPSHRCDFGFGLALSETRLAIAHYGTGPETSAVSLYSYCDADLADLALETTIGGMADVNYPLRDVFDISLRGDVLAISETIGCDSPQRGAVHLFRHCGEAVERMYSFRPGAVARKDVNLVVRPERAFGHSVSLGHRMIAIGDDKHGGAAETDNKYGGVHIWRFDNDDYERPQYSQVIGVDHPSLALRKDDFLGASCEIDGDRLWVGAPGDDGAAGTDGYGAVYGFDIPPSGPFALATSIGMAKSIPVSLGQYDRFGYALAADCGRLAVGCPQNDAEVPQSGRVYLYPASELPQEPVTSA